MKQLVRMPKGSTKDQVRQLKCAYCVVISCLYGKTDVCVLSSTMTIMGQCLLFTTRGIAEGKAVPYSNTGYYTQSDSGEVTYNQNALSLPYFMCSRETGLSVKLLQRLDMECLIGQISYKQSAEIYNSYHGYECTESELEKKRYILLI